MLSKDYHMLRGCETIPLPPAPVPHPLFPLFYQVEIRHWHVRQSLPRARSRLQCLGQYHAITAIEWLSICQIHADNIGNYDAVVAWPTLQRPPR